MDQGNVHRGRQYIQTLFIRISPWELFPEIDSNFVKTYLDHLDHEWMLTDPVGKTHIVRFNRSRINPRLTLGWSPMLDFYQINCLHWGILGFKGESLFDISIFTDFLTPIKYEPAPPIPGLLMLPAPSVGDAAVDNNQPNVPVEHDLFPVPELAPPNPIEGPPEMYQYVWTTTISLYASTHPQMSVPMDVANFLRQWPIEPWCFRGPFGMIVSINILQSDRSCKFGAGWRLFCGLHGIMAGDIVTFKFTDGHLRYVDVTIAENMFL